MSARFLLELAVLALAAGVAFYAAARRADSAITCAMEALDGE